MTTYRLQFPNGLLHPFPFFALERAESFRAQLERGGFTGLQVVMVTDCKPVTDDDCDDEFDGTIERAAEEREGYLYPKEK